MGGKFRFDFIQQWYEVAIDASNHLRYNAINLMQKGSQQMLGFNLRMVEFACDALGIEDGLLGFLSKTIKIHKRIIMP